MKWAFAFILLATVISCDDSFLEDASDMTFRVTTVGTVMGCGLAVIDFKKEDLERMQSITNCMTLRYNANGLDRNQYGENGIQLTIKVRKPLTSESTICTMMGPTYPLITVVWVYP